MRGNTVMVGYFDDPEATETAFRGGWGGWRTRAIEAIYT